MGEHLIWRHEGPQFRKSEVDNSFTASYRGEIVNLKFYRTAIELEEELTLPYHQILLDLGDGNAATLQSVFINMSAHVSKDGLDFDGLYSKAAENILVSRR